MSDAAAPAAAPAAAAPGLPRVSSFEELERRIRGRGTDSEDAIQRRLTRAREELEAQQEFDAVVINDDLESALNQVETLMGLG